MRRFLFAAVLLVALTGSAAFAWRWWKARPRPGHATETHVPGTVPETVHDRLAAAGGLTHGYIA